MTLNISHNLKIVKRAVLSVLPRHKEIIPAEFSSSVKPTTAVPSPHDELYYFKLEPNNLFLLKVTLVRYLAK